MSCTNEVMFFTQWIQRPSSVARGSQDTSTQLKCFIMILVIDTRHKKTDLKVFVVVIPKEGLGPANPSLNIISEGSRVIFYSRCHTQRRIGGAPPANPSLGMAMTKTLRSVFSWHAWYDNPVLILIKIFYSNDL